MFRKFRRRMAAVGLAIASLFPNPGKVSFMGARDTAKAVVATIETVGVKAEPVVEKVASAATAGGGKAAAAGVGSVGLIAGGAAIKGCSTTATVGKDLVEIAPRLGKGAAEAASGLEKLAAEGASRLGTDAGEVGSAIPKELGEGAESLANKGPDFGSTSRAAGETDEFPRYAEPRPLPGAGAGWLVRPPAYSVAKSAVESSGLRITGAISSRPETLITERILHEESIRMTESLIMRLGPADLQSQQAVARAFDAAVEPANMFHAALDRRTGLVRMHMARNGVVVAAEFNLYSAAEAAGTALAAPYILGNKNGAAPQRP